MEGYDIGQGAVATPAYGLQADGTISRVPGGYVWTGNYGYMSYTNVGHVRAYSSGSRTPGTVTPGSVTPGATTPTYASSGTVTPVQRSCRRYASASTASTVAIDNKIEQAMDLVKSHLMFAVREEVEVLKEKISELMDRINQLEQENTTLRQNASPDALHQVAGSSSSSQQPHHSNT